ncbi:hypothetical protein N181_03395 [Sinorhizobium fredii USDA 205]|nr:hypothetical protein N181_03395 [Sinorhizobium fredii USDA 205]
MAFNGINDLFSAAAPFLVAMPSVNRFRQNPL